MGIWVGITVTLVFLCTGVVWYIQERNRARELAGISSMLEDILNDRDIDGGRPGADQEELSSKICHQLLRLQNMTRGYHTRIEHDRDSIKKLITEIAHQLRTPLTNIETYLDFLRDEQDGGRRAQYLEAAKRSERKICFLTESFIKMSRLENRIIQIRREETDLLPTLRGALMQAEEKAQKKGIDICPCFPERIGYRHDANWLSEAVYNLLDNAVKYSDSEGSIQIGAEANEMFVRIWVRDYGIGIEPEDEAKVFQRFYRGKNAAKKEGFGIGLYLTREIVLLHQGFVRLKRKKDGTLAEIYLSLIED